MAGYTLPRTDVYDLRSQSGAAYRIFLGWPELAAPPSGYPLILVLDGNAHFATVLEAYRLRTVNADQAGFTPALVVGIGYPVDTALDMERRTLDYTPSVERAHLPPRPNGGTWSATGGVDTFLSFIADTLIPSIDTKFPIDRARVAIMGHSFGGLLSLYAMMARPGLFCTHVAGSPSIWFAKQLIHDALHRYVAGKSISKSRPSLLMTAGSLEEKAESNGGEITRWRLSNRMVGNARDAAAILAQAPAACDLHFEIFDNLDHVSVVPAMIGRAVAHLCEAPQMRSRVSQEVEICA